MAGEPRRMAESWKQFGKLRVKELPSFVKKNFTREKLENLVESTWTTFYNYNKQYPDGEHRAYQPYLAFGRFPSYAVVWSTRVTGALTDGPLSCIICVTLRRSPGTTAAQAPTK